MKNKIGAFVASVLPAVHGDVKAGILKIKDMGFGGVQINRFPPDTPLDQQKAIIDFARAEGLTLTALSGDMSTPDTRSLLERTKILHGTVDLAAAAGVPIVIVHGGERVGDAATAADTREAWRRLIENLKYMTRYGRDHGVWVAMEPGGPVWMVHGWKILARLRDEIGDLFKINYDPANVILAGEDAIEGARVLAGSIVHMHAKDAKAIGPFPSMSAFNRRIDKRKDDCDFVEFLRARTADSVEINGKKTACFQQTPVGKGDVDFRLLLNVLDGAGFTGWIVMEREGSSSPIEDIEHGREHLLACMAS